MNSNIPHIKHVSYYLMICVLTLGLAACSGNSNSQSVPVSNAPSPEVLDNSLIQDLPLISLQQISEHSVEADCWIGISDGVYDVTGFIESNSHPGGEAIFEGCGKDATELFDTRPMGSGTPHSNEARELLASYRIGNLIQ